MLKSPWLRNAAPRIALVIAWVILIAFSVLENSDQKYSQGTKRATEQKQQVSSPEALTRNAVAQPPKPKPNPSRDEWREEQDLKAQRQMADWALGMLLVSAIGLGVTAAGVVFVAWTLNATRDTNKITKEIGQAQVRCYPSIEKLTVRFDKNWGENIRFASEGRKYLLKGNCPTFEMEIKNYGQSPARNVRGKIKVGYISHFSRNDTSSRSDTFKTSEHGEMISAGDTIKRSWFFAFPLNERELKATGTGSPISNTLKMFLAVTLSFEDVFEIDFTELWFFEADIDNLVDVIELKRGAVQRIGKVPPVRPPMEGRKPSVKS